MLVKENQQEVREFARGILGSEPSWPVDHYIELLFFRDSPHSSFPKFSERLRSVCQSEKPSIRGKSALTSIVPKVLSYLRTQEYFEDEDEYHDEYQKCKSVLDGWFK